MVSAVSTWGPSPSWLESVSDRATAEIKAEQRSATSKTQAAMARELARAILILAEEYPHLARLTALAVEHGHAVAVPEWPDPGDMWTLQYSVEVKVPGERITLCVIPWRKLRLKAAEVEAEYRARGL